MSPCMRGVRRSAVGEAAAMSHLGRPPARGEPERAPPLYYHRRGRRSQPGELDPGLPVRLPGSRRIPLEVEHQGDDRRGERLHAPVVILNVRVVEAAGRLDTVL